MTNGTSVEQMERRRRRRSGQKYAFNSYLKEITRYLNWHNNININCDSSQKHKKRPLFESNY